MVIHGDFVGLIGKLVAEKNDFAFVSPYIELNGKLCPSTEDVVQVLAVDVSRYFHIGSLVCTVLYKPSQEQVLSLDQMPLLGVLEHQASICSFAIVFADLIRYVDLFENLRMFLLCLFTLNFSRSSPYQ